MWLAFWCCVFMGLNDRSFLVLSSTELSSIITRLCFIPLFYLTQSLPSILLSRSSSFTNYLYYSCLLISEWNVYTILSSIFITSTNMVSLGIYSANLNLNSCNWSSLVGCIFGYCLKHGLSEPCRTFDDYRLLHLFLASFFKLLLLIYSFKVILPSLVLLICLLGIKIIIIFVCWIKGSFTSLLF